MDEGGKERGARVTVTQQEILLSFMEKNSELRKVCVDVGEKSKCKMLWYKITEELNEAGPPKPMRKWKKVWNDWRAKVRKKCDDLREQSGKYKLTTCLSPLEDRVVKLAKEECGLVTRINTVPTCEEPETAATVPCLGVGISPPLNGQESPEPRRKKRKMAAPGVLERMADSFRENADLMEAVLESVKNMSEVVKEMAAILKEIKQEGS